MPYKIQYPTSQCNQLLIIRESINYFCSSHITSPAHQISKKIMIFGSTWESINYANWQMIHSGSIFQMISTRSIKSNDLSQWWAESLFFTHSPVTKQQNLLKLSHSNQQIWKINSERHERFIILMGQNQYMQPLFHYEFKLQMH